LPTRKANWQFSAADFLLWGESLQLLVGLGNPGEKYAFTRHNIGFWVIDELSKYIQLKEKRIKHRTSIFAGVFYGEEVVLAKPLTYMNRSGLAVISLLEHYSLPVERLLVIYDDMDLELGKIRLRSRGGSGGHRGMDSIIKVLERDDFPRLRMGIGRQMLSDDVSFLLSPFTPEEQETVKEMVQRGTEALKVFIAEGINEAMNKYNTKN